MPAPPLFDMLSFAERVRRSFKPALFIVLSLTFLALVILLLIPRNYISEAVILPPYRGASADLITQFSGLLGGLGKDFILPAMVTPSDLYAALIQSPRVIDPVIKRFDLMRRYNAQYITGARSAFKKRLTVKLTREGMVKVRYRERRPQLAADIVNALIDELDKLNRELRIWSARNYRLFVEERLEEVKRELTERKLALVDFQEIYNLPSPEEQARFALSSAASLEAEILKTELELSYLSNYLRESSPEIRALKKRIENLQLKLDSLSVESATILPPIGQLPELYYEYLALLREYKVSEVLYEYLSQQYEQARIEEAKDIPVIQLLYKAQPQPAIFIPKRKTITIIVFLCSVIIVFLWLLFLHIIERWKELNPERSRRLERIYEAFLRELRLKR